ncbi:Domain of unknown function DUF2520 [Dehalogenimonas lykanthroporepellens BL-DC-9]|nr:Domain of unknown function DUF2520 [Dehalogenimonas lykanthroporepellens BL-DC-9]
MTERNITIGFIGAGRMGSALAGALSAAGYPVTAVASRSDESACKLAGRLPSASAVSPQQAADTVELLFITTPDRAIAEVAGSIAARPGLMVCHVSAATPRLALASLENEGALTGVFHPLLAAGSREQADIPPGTTFAIEAAEPLLGTLHRLANAVSGHSIELKSADRVLYHASAVLASNYLVTLLDRAAALWQGFAGRQEALSALLPLVRGTLDNIENIGIPDCLTGPVARGDVATVAAHLEALTGADRDVRDIYRVLGRATVPLALSAGGIDRQRAAELESLLEKCA